MTSLKKLICCCCPPCFRRNRGRTNYVEIEPQVEPISFVKGSGFTQYNDATNSISILTENSIKQYVSMQDEIRVLRKENLDLNKKNDILSNTRDRTKHLESRIENKEEELAGLIDENRKMSSDIHELRLNLERTQEENARLRESDQIQKRRIRALEDNNTRLDLARKEHENNLITTNRRLQLINAELAESRTNGESLRDENESLRKELVVAESKAEQSSYLPEQIKKMESTLSNLECEELLLEVKSLVKHDDSIWERSSFFGYKKAKFTEDCGSGKTLEDRIIPLMLEMDKCSGKLQKMERSLESMVNFSNQILTNRVKLLTSQYREVRRRRMDLEQRRQALYLQLMKEKKKSEEEQKEEEEEEEDFCKICFERPRNCVFMPCKHFCCCSECAKKILQQNGICPIGRQPIRSIIDGIYHV